MSVKWLVFSAFLRVDKLALFVKAVRSGSQFLVGQTEFRVCRGDSASSDHTEVIKC